LIGMASGLLAQLRWSVVVCSHPCLHLGALGAAQRPNKPPPRVEN
jgi:hypothetical protein